MMKILEKALDNPAATFQTPSDVLACGELSREDKIAVLRRWEYDARLLEVAEEENMMSGNPGILSDVLKALQALDAERPMSAPTKSGGAGRRAQGTARAM